jgi:peptide/nickel transport system permease protein
MGLVYFLAARTLRVLIVVVGLVVVMFLLTRTLTEPVNVILGPNSSVEQRATLNRELGFDQPLFSQFVDYIGGLVRGDLGESLSLDRPAIDAIVERLPASFLLAGTATVFAAFVGLGLGVMGGLKPGSLIDRITVGISSFSVAIPDFWLGLMFILVFSVNLGWLPTGGYEGLAEPKYLILPAITLALLPAGRLARVVRESVAEEMTKDYVVAARSRGMRTPAIVRRHVIKNIAVPATTVIGFDFLLLFAGYGATVEVVFGWPGVGRLAIQATIANDIILVSAMVVVTGIIVGVGNIVLDVIHALIDRRIAV